MWGQILECWPVDTTVHTFKIQEDFVDDEYIYTNIDICVDMSALRDWERETHKYTHSLKFCCKSVLLRSLTNIPRTAKNVSPVRMFLTNVQWETLPSCFSSHAVNLIRDKIHAWPPEDGKRRGHCCVPQEHLLWAQLNRVRIAAQTPLVMMSLRQVTQYFWTLFSLF